MAVIKKENSYMGLPMNIARGNPVPLDKTEIWYSLAEMENYAKTSVVAYVGQIVQLVDETNNTATAYIIANTAGDLIEVGSSTLGDNKTIELTDDGILRIVGSANASKGAQLVMGDNGTVSWVMPDTTTVEGLNTAVAALGGRVDVVEGTIGEHGERIGDLETTLSGMGSIFNFVGSYSEAEALQLNKDLFQAGDVILVDGSKEYVLIEYEETVPDPDGEEGATKVVTSKRWEILGDPSGVTALEERVTTIENWKNSTNTALSTMGTDIENAKTSITNLVNKDTEINNALNLKASKEELNVVDGKTITNANAISGIQTDISGINTALESKADQVSVNSSLKDIRDTLSTKADKSAVDTIISTYATDDELTQGLALKVDLTSYNTQIDLLNQADTQHNQDIAGVKATADKAKADLETLTEVVGTKASAQSVTDLTGRVSKNESDISSHAQSINSLSGSITGLTNNKADKSTVEALDGAVKANTKAISDHAAEYTALAGRVTQTESDVAKAQEDATKGISDAAAANTAAVAAQAKGEEALAKANEVLGATDDTADKNTVYGAKAAAAAADAKAVAAQGKVDALEDVVSALDSAYQTADAALSARIDKIDGVIGGVQGAMHFVGVSTIDPSTGVVAITGKDDYVPADGDVVIYEKKETIDGVETVVATIEYVRSGFAWVELGDVSAEAKRIGALEARMVTAEVETAKITGIQNDISSNASAIESLAARVKVNEEYKTTNDAALGALAARVTANEEAIAKEITDRTNAIAGEKTARENAIAAEQSTRATAISGLQDQIDIVVAKLTWTKIGE